MAKGRCKECGSRDFTADLPGTVTVVVDSMMDVKEIIDSAVSPNVKSWGWPSDTVLICKECGEEYSSAEELSYDREYEKYIEPFHEKDVILLRHIDPEVYLDEDLNEVSRDDFEKLIKSEDHAMLVDIRDGESSCLIALLYSDGEYDSQLCAGGESHGSAMMYLKRRGSNITVDQNTVRLAQIMPNRYEEILTQWRVK